MVMRCGRASAGGSRLKRRHGASGFAGPRPPYECSRCTCEQPTGKHRPRSCDSRVCPACRTPLAVGPGAGHVERAVPLGHVTRDLSTHRGYVSSPKTCSAVPAVTANGAGCCCRCCRLGMTTAVLRQTPNHTASAPTCISRPTQQIDGPRCSRGCCFTSSPLQPHGPAAGLGR